MEIGRVYSDQMKKFTEFGCEKQRIQNKGEETDPNIFFRS